LMSVSCSAVGLLRGLCHTAYGPRSRSYTADDAAGLAPNSTATAYVLSLLAALRHRDLADVYTAADGDDGGAGTAGEWDATCAGYELIWRVAEQGRAESTVLRPCKGVPVVRCVLDADPGVCDS
jgi:hypothetical protein